MPLFTVMVVCLLLSLSDEIAITGIFLGFTSLTCITFVIFGTPYVEERIGTRKLDWPMTALKRASLYWGVAAVVFVAQLSTIVFDSGIPNIYEALFLGGLALCGIACFESYLMFRFIMNPQYQPQIDLTGALLCFMFGVIDTLTLYFFVPTYPKFEEIPFVSKIFIILLIPSFASSFLYLWAWWTGKSALLKKGAYAMALSPYVFLVGVILLGYLLRLIFFG